jgi:hypothetical protein
MPLAAQRFFKVIDFVQRLFQVCRFPCIIEIVEQQYWQVCPPVALGQGAFFFQLYFKGC